MSFTSSPSSPPVPLAVVDPLPATIATIVIIGLIMSLPVIVYFRIVFRFVCNKSLQKQLVKEEQDKLSFKLQLQPPPPVLLSFEDVTYTVRKTGHNILAGVTGWFAPQTLTAILGTSGCGKTTLLSVLADQMDPTGASTGTVMANAVRTREMNFRQRVAYVLQSDNLMESLTIKEVLWFAAELRLSKQLSQVEKMSVVRELLVDLDLTLVANQRIYLLSGGQKRRVTVACELVSRPSMVFLDEPTSGLDASGSLKLVRVLRGLADQGRTIVATIHQPRIDAFNLFHMMILMDKGRALYFGPVTKVLSFMNSGEGGVELSDGENPADFVLDLTHGSEDQVAQLTQKYLDSDLCQSVKQVVERIHSGLLREQEFYGFSDDLEWFPQLHLFPGNKEDEDPNAQTTNTLESCSCCEWYYVFAYTSSFLKQHFTLIRRSLLNEWRNKSYVMTWIMGIIMMLFMGMLYCYVSPPPLNSQSAQVVEQNLVEWGACTQNVSQLNMILNTTSANETLEQCGYDLTRSLQLELARTSLLYQLLASMFFSEMPMIAIMFQDRQLFAREHAAQSYSTFSWILSWVSKLSFTGLVKGLIYPPFVYFSAQLTLSAEAYFLFCIFMGVMSIAGSTFALLAVVLFSSPESATVAFVCLNVVTQNLSGYFISIDYMPWWFRWMTYFNFFSYSFHGITIAQDLSPNAWAKADAEGMDVEYKDLELDAWVSALVAVLLCVAFQVVTFVVLVVSGGNRLKRRRTTTYCCSCPPPPPTAASIPIPIAAAAAATTDQQPVTIT